MPIPESQLETWARQGAIVAAKDSHVSVRTALDPYDWPEGVSYDPYLQGSYKNDTNIRGDSDVDLVVELTSAYIPDTSLLSQQQLAAYNASRIPATYSWQEFHDDVLRCLVEYYGARDVDDSPSKCIKVKTPYLPTDVVVCMTYRRFTVFYGQFGFPQYVEGMTFYVPQERRWVVNYPKLHFENGKDKNKQLRTSGRYKPFVRMLKNARCRLLDEGDMSENVAPSYFLESLIYNMPDGHFAPTYQATVLNFFDWFVDGSKREVLICQNGLVPLYGDTPEQWSEQNADLLVDKLMDLWIKWG